MDTEQLKREDGQTMAEYGVVLGLITLGIVTALAFYADKMRLAFERVAEIFPGV